VVEPPGLVPDAIATTSGLVTNEIIHMMVVQITDCVYTFYCKVTSTQLTAYNYCKVQN